MNNYQPLGPLMIDVNGIELKDEEKKRLLHPAVGGVILFRRNFKSIKQLKKLVTSIKQLRTPELVIAVDHEGGRVQRFIEGFTRLPAMQELGKIWDIKGSYRAINLTIKTGLVLATELRSCGIDLSFTPILDLNWGKSDVIGNRSFHHDPEIVSQLASALQKGLFLGGMISCGKHFPGHGYAQGDSHTTIPVDDRPFEQILENDIHPFLKLIQSGMTGIMPAHVIYPKVDQEPAGFSSIWLKDILRTQLAFDGVVFSDDLTMEGASVAGNIIQRVSKAMEAGCNILLICNRPDLVEEALPHIPSYDEIKVNQLWEKVRGKGESDYYQTCIDKNKEFKKAQKKVSSLFHQDCLANSTKVGEAS